MKIQSIYIQHRNDLFCAFPSINSWWGTERQNETERERENDDEAFLYSLTTCLVKSIYSPYATACEVRDWKNLLETYKIITVCLVNGCYGDL